MLPRRALIFLAVAWILVMLYPDPGMLVRSIRNTARPQIEPEAVAAIAARLPDDPRAIEAYVLDGRCRTPTTGSRPACPGTSRRRPRPCAPGAGDCESRAVVLASILTAKGIPNELRLSLDHIWVDYPGKQANAIENAGVQFAGTRERPLLPALALGLPAGPGGLRPAGDLLDAGAGVARAAAGRRPLADRRSGTRWRAAGRGPARRRRPAAGAARPGGAGAAARRRPGAGRSRRRRGRPARSASDAGGRPRAPEPPAARQTPGPPPRARCDRLSAAPARPAEEAP